MPSAVLRVKCEPNVLIIVKCPQQHKQQAIKQLCELYVDRAFKIHEKRHIIFMALYSSGGYLKKNVVSNSFYSKEDVSCL